MSSALVLENLVKHFTMLRRDTNSAFDLLSTSQGLYNGRHFDRLWPGPEDGKNAQVICHLLRAILLLVDERGLKASGAPIAVFQSQNWVQKFKTDLPRTKLFKSSTPLLAIILMAG